MTRSVRIKGELVADGGFVDLDQEDYRLADGTRLTEAKVEELAAEILAPSRPRASVADPPGVHSPQLRLSVPTELRDRLRQRAEAEHRSVSNLVRDALEHYLAS